MVNRYARVAQRGVRGQRDARRADQSQKKQWYEGYEFPMTPAAYASIQEERGRTAASRGEAQAQVDEARAAIPGFTQEDFTAENTADWVNVRVIGRDWRPQTEEEMMQTWDRMQSDIEMGRPTAGATYGSYDELVASKPLRSVPNTLIREYRLPPTGVDKMLQAEAFNNGDFTYNASTGDDGTVTLHTQARGQSPGEDMGINTGLVRSLDNANREIQADLKANAIEAENQYNTSLGRAESQLSTAEANIAGAAGQEEQALANAGEGFQDRSNRARETALGLKL